MQPALMIDNSQPVTAADLAMQTLPGVVAVARPLFAGATDASGNVPVKIAVPLTAAEVAEIHAAGKAVLPYANNIGWGDCRPPCYTGCWVVVVCYGYRVVELIH